MKFFLNDNIPLSVILASFLLAFFIDVRAINWAIVYGWLGGLSAGLMNLLYPFCVSLILVVILFQYFLLKKFKIKKISAFLAFYLLLFYYFTNNFVGPPSIPFLMFGVTTICAFVIPQVLTIHVPLFLKATMALPSFAILNVDKVFASTVNWDMRLSMDTSYAFIIPIIANIVYLFKYFRLEEGVIPRFFTLTFSLINFKFFLLILQFGSRGPLVCVVLLFIWFYISDFRNGFLRINKKKLTIALLSITLLFFFALILLTVLETYLQSVHIEINALTKILSLAENGDISNGREDINTITIRGIFESPIWGWGLDRFDANTFLQYPHNFILQTLYDGGILLLVILYVPIICYMKRKFHKQDIDKYSYLSSMFFASVPGALFSQDLWAIPILWISFGTMISTSIYPSCGKHKRCNSRALIKLFYKR